MVTVEYASELNPLLELSLSSDWFVAVILEPGQSLADSDLPEDRLLGQLLSSGNDQRIVASRVTFLYYRGFESYSETSMRDNQILARYDSENAQYELSSVLAEATVSTADEAIE